jgi:lysophospholipase L1-like esterase
MAVLHLPHLKAALAVRAEGIIVAFGSSSTRGAMATDLAHSYPAVLQTALTRALRSSHVAVINRGIGGQDAPQELERLEADVIAVRPQVVIWQVGANGAVQNTAPLAFEQHVTIGVERLKAAGIDVILMDNQRSAKIMAAVGHAAVESALAQVARVTDVNLFSRGRLMDAWGEEGNPPALFLASDGMHHNDLGYLCVAESLAQQIIAAVTPPAAMSASR